MINSTTQGLICEAAVNISKVLLNLTENRSDTKYTEELICKREYNPNEDYRGRKKNTLVLSGTYVTLDKLPKAERVRNCGTFLSFEDKRLIRANFCRCRLCPMCMWRQSRSTAGQITKLMNYIAEEDTEARFALLTLTQGRVPGGELTAEVGKVLKAWIKVTKLRGFEKLVKGFVRALEITHDTEKKITKKMFNTKKRFYMSRGLTVGDINPYYDTYHTHLHVIFDVNKQYSNRLRSEYTRLSENMEWSNWWRNSLGVDYSPVVDIRTFNKERGHGAYELAKYVVKPDDYIYSDRGHMTETVRVLDAALFDRVLIAYAGSFRKARKALKLEDTMTDEMPEDEKQTRRTSNWYWHFGYSQYRKMGEP